jgi:outer membrane protein, heavy metal efflux system
MRTLVFLLLLAQVHEHRRSDVVPMTLAAIEAEAIENNREIRTMNERLALAKAGILPAMGIDDPSFTYRAWGTPLLAPWNVNQTQHMFMYSQTIPAKGKRELRYAIANADVSIVEAQLEATKLDVLARVRATFYELLRNQNELDLHEQQSALAQQAVAAARIKYTVGRVPQQDVLKAQVGLTKLADHLAMFLQDGDLSRARLNVMMGRDAGAPLEVEGEYAMPVALPDFASLQRTALEKRPDLKAIEAEIRQLDIKVRLTQKNLKPDVTVGAGYMIMPSGSMSRNAYMAELSFNLPWLNRSKHTAEIEQAQSAVAVRRAELERQKSEAFQQIQEALIRSRTAARLAELYRDTLRPQAQATMRAASAAYQTDQTDLLNLIDSQNSALDIEYSYFRALAEFDSQVAHLEGLIGDSIPRESVARMEARDETK